MSINPKSLSNLNKGPEVRRKPGKNRNVKVASITEDICTRLGNDNLTDGVNAVAKIVADLEALASLCNISLEELLKIVPVATKAHISTYPDIMRFPQSLVTYLWQQAEKGDEEAQQHLDYIENWAATVALDEVVAEDIKTKDGSWII